MKRRSFTAGVGSGSRVERLRHRIVHAPMEICVERARYLTQAMAMNWNQHPLSRISCALENILHNIAVIIREDELIVGCRTSKLKGAPLFPENKVRWIEGDLEGFNERHYQRVQIEPFEMEEIARDIIPFWKGKTVEEYFESLLPPDVFEDMNKYIFAILLEITNGVGHFTMDYDTMMKQGLTGIIAEAETRCQALLPEEQNSEKGLFYKATVRTLRAAIAFANRYAVLAETMAESEPDPNRISELREIARVCRRVPEYPPETFHEAIQFIYFIHLISQIESGGNSISLGRVDQYLYPYYQRDLQSGRTTPEKARELLALLFIKVNEIWNVLEEAFIPAGEGPEGKTTQNVTVGGVDIYGRDATNELSYLGLEAYAKIQTVQPNFGVRISSQSPPDFLKKSIQYAMDGVAIHFFNDDAIISALLNAGHSLQDARNYGVVGCVEPSVQGKNFGSTFAVQFNAAKCMEFALSNGIDNIFGFQAGIATGPPETFTSFDDVWRAYTQQVSHFISQMARGMECMDQAVAECLPSPFASAMIQGPLTRGIDLTRGGALYNATGVQVMGFSNVVDGLFAVKKAVFEDGKFAIGDLGNWLAENWIESENERNYLLNKVAKFGNDIPEVDDMGVRVLNHFCDELSRYETYRNGSFWPGVFSVGFHITLGAFTAATPDGRFAGEVLGNGLTPSNGVALCGPTALMNSVSQMPVFRLWNGANLNMRFSPNQAEAGKLAALVKGFFSQGGLQVQFNMIDSKVLRAAQKDPAQYQDIVVRVSGYSAYFVNLTDIAQEEIISRCEYTM